jgi:hypothetical protein
MARTQRFAVKLSPFCQPAQFVELPRGVTSQSSVLRLVEIRPDLERSNCGPVPLRLTLRDESGDVGLVLEPDENGQPLPCHDTLTTLGMDAVLVGEHHDLYPVSEAKLAQHVATYRLGFEIPSAPPQQCSA